MPNAFSTKFSINGFRGGGLELLEMSIAIVGPAQSR